jgi:putative endonuclease
VPKREYKFFVYIMASKSRVLYTGITNNLEVRVRQHKTGQMAGFTKQYRVHRLVYFESFQYVNSAIAREKEIKHWTRQRRVQLIESMNTTWQDLAACWFDEEALENPNGPAVLKHDAGKIQTFGDFGGQCVAPLTPPEESIRIKFRRSQVRSFSDSESE